MILKVGTNSRLSPGRTVGFVRIPLLARYPGRAVVHTSCYADKERFITRITALRSEKTIRAKFCPCGHYRGINTQIYPKE